MAVEAGAADVVRRFYDAVAERDLEVVASCFGENAVWVLPGRSSIAGEHRGWAAIWDDFLTSSTLSPEAPWRFGSSMSRSASATSLDVTGVQLMRVEGGKIVEVRGHYSDQYAFDQFWS